MKDDIYAILTVYEKGRKWSVSGKVDEIAKKLQGDMTRDFVGKTPSKAERKKGERELLDVLGVVMFVVTLALAHYSVLTLVGIL